MNQLGLCFCFFSLFLHGFTETKKVPNNIIILVGLPKSGTTSIHDALLRLKIKSAHFEAKPTFCKHHANFYPVPAVNVGRFTSSGVSNDINNNNNNNSVSNSSLPSLSSTSPKTSMQWSQVDEITGMKCYVGIVIQRAIADGLHPLEPFVDKGYRAFAQMDVCYPSFNISVWPQIDALQNLVASYPDAYYILTRRTEVSAHAASMMAWHHMAERFKEAGLLNRFTNNNNEGGVNRHNKTDYELLENFIKGVTFYTEEFFERRPYLKFLDIYIEDKQAAQKIAWFLGIDSFPLAHDNTGHYTSKHTASPTPTALFVEESKKDDDDEDDDDEDDDEEEEEENTDDDGDDGGPGKFKNRHPDGYHDDHT